MIRRVKLLLVGSLIIVVVFIATSVVIGNEVSEVCRQESERYKRECVDSLIQAVDDGERNYGERNKAIWALGQLGDIRARNVLYKHVREGDRDERGSYETIISQYELSKAIKLIDGGVNLSAIVWR